MATPYRKTGTPSNFRTNRKYAGKPDFAAGANKALSYKERVALLSNPRSAAGKAAGAKLGAHMKTQQVKAEKVKTAPERGKRAIKRAYQSAKGPIPAAFGRGAMAAEFKNKELAMRHHGSLARMHQANNLVHARELVKGSDGPGGRARGKAYLAGYKAGGGLGKAGRHRPAGSPRGGQFY